MNADTQIIMNTSVTGKTILLEAEAIVPDTPIYRSRWIITPLVREPMVCVSGDQLNGLWRLTGDVYASF